MRARLVVRQEDPREVDLSPEPAAERGLGRGGREPLPRPGSMGGGRSEILPVPVIWKKSLSLSEFGFLILKMFD